MTKAHSYVIRTRSGVVPAPRVVGSVPSRGVCLRIALLLLACCDYRIPDNELACSTVSDCPTSFFCSAGGRCVSTRPDAGTDAGRVARDASPDIDGGADRDASIDAGAPDAGAPFDCMRECSRLAGGRLERRAEFSTMVPDVFLTFTRDRRVILASRVDEGTGTGIFRADAAAAGAPPGSWSLVPGLNAMDASDESPTVVTDRAGAFAIVFNSTRDTGVRLYYAAWMSRDSAAAPTLRRLDLGGPNDGNPFYDVNTETLYFTSDRSNAGDLYRSPRIAETDFGTPIAVAELNTSQPEFSPVLRPDGRVLYFARNPTTRLDIFCACRPTLGDAWSESPTPVLSEDRVENVPVFAESDRLYISSNRAGGDRDIWVLSEP